MTRQDYTYITILIATCALVLFLGLGNTTLWNMDEGRYANIAKQMDKSGKLSNFIVLHLEGEPYYNKLPLMHWMIFASANLLGGYSEFNVRFPAALFGTGCIILAYIMGCIFYEKRLAFFSAIILLTMFGFTIPARFCKADIVMLFFEMAAFYAFARWYFAKAKFNLWLFYIPLGLAYYCKGPLAFVLAGLAIAPFLFIVKDLKAVRDMRLITGALIIVAMMLPWYIGGYLVAGRDFIDGIFYYFKGQNLDAFFGSGGHIKESRFPPFYYVLQFLARGLPWSIFLPVAIWIAFKRFDSEKKRWFIFLLVWFSAVLIFFSIAGAKRTNYILPLYPAGAFMVAAICDIKKQKLFYALSIAMVLIHLPYAMYYEVKESDSDGKSGVAFCENVKKVVPQESKIYFYKVYKSHYSFYIDRMVPRLEEAELNEELKKPATFYLLAQKLHYDSEDLLQKNFDILLQREERGDIYFLLKSRQNG